MNNKHVAYFDMGRGFVSYYGPSPYTRTDTPLRAEYPKPGVYQEVAKVGWICPVCGRGNAPFNPTCYCQNGKAK